MSAKDTLIKAKEILAERGVNRDGKFVSQQDGCKVCAIGAIKLALGGEVVPTVTGYYIRNPYDDDFVREQEEAWRVLERTVTDSPRGEWVPEWNDATESDEEVLAGFDRAIKSLSNG